jgi:hypothetical protein
MIRERSWVGGRRGAKVLERALGVVLLAVGLGVPSGCQRPAEDRAARDLEIGKAGDGTLAVRVVGGLAAVRELSPSRLVLWCSARTRRTASRAIRRAPSRFRQSGREPTRT